MVVGMWLKFQQVTNYDKIDTNIYKEYPPYIFKMDTETQTNKYENAKIYKLTCSKTGRIYIGSTCISLKRRNYDHIRKDRENKCSSNLLINPLISLIKNYPCKTKEDLLWEERYHIETTPCVNIKVPIRNEDEMKHFHQNYRKTHKVEIKANNKKWNENNQEYLIDYRLNYRINNLDKIKIADKQKYQKNRIKLIEQAKVRYEKNKDAINAIRKIKHECPCGGNYQNISKSRHFKSKKHIDYLELVIINK